MSVTSSTPPRNQQLDFFRGLALMIIFINHMPGNPWLNYTPSRLGPSDAAETFVFLSGFAAAIAFGRNFSQAGIAIGSIRVLFRCAQIYAAHLALFVLMVTLFALLSSLQIIDEQWHLDNVDYFFDHTQAALLSLVSLRYVPNFISILPMYLVIMLWLPAVWFLSRFHTGLALLFSVALYVAARLLGWELTADPVTGADWYFNPFCWQLIFFTGFAFGNGWLTIPRCHSALVLLCIVFVVFCFPLDNEPVFRRLPGFAALHDKWPYLLDKSHLGFVRYLHFLAMAYLATTLVNLRPHWLHSTLTRKIMAMGQQSLPVFMLSTCLSFVGGALINDTDITLLNSAWANITGLGLMMLFAHLLNWLDQKPWKSVSQTTRSEREIAWTAHHAFALWVLLLSAAPMLLLEPQKTQAASVASREPITIVTLDPPPPITEDVVYKPTDDMIDKPDTL
ncbi:MAG: OpgC family protein [Methylomonas sp.]